jgi:hypothetical protein
MGCGLGQMIRATGCVLFPLTSKRRVEEEEEEEEEEAAAAAAAAEVMRARFENFPRYNRQHITKLILGSVLF